MKKFLAIISVLFLTAGTALAVPFGPGGGAELQAVLDGLTTNPNPGDSGIDVTTDEIVDGNDTYWSITATGGSVNTLIVELASFKDDNIFGVYDANDSAKTVSVFGGADSAGAQSTLSIKADGSVYVNNADSGIDFAGNAFGYFLDSSANTGGGVFYSDTSLNDDGADHMAAYRGANIDTVQLPTFFPGLWTDNEIILAWEDLDFGNTDADYTDFVVMVESVNPLPVPEPATMLLLGTGLLAVAGCWRRKSKKSHLQLPV